jgi:predicted NAD/FAD-dependent oxidoreductase
MATPPENIRKVLGTTPVAAGVLETIGPVRMLPTWAAMVAFDQPLSLPFDAAFVRDDAVLSWAALENSKPGRRGCNDRPAAALGAGAGGVPSGGAGMRERWVLHASHAWSLAKVELTPDEAAAAMLAAFSRHAAVALGRQLPTLMAESALPMPSFVAAHRWRYAAVETPLTEPCVLDAQSLLGVCGDWCGQGPSRVEKAVLSGAALAGQVMGQLAIRTGDQALG